MNMTQPTIDAAGAGLPSFPNFFGVDSAVGFYPDTHITPVNETMGAAKLGAMGDGTPLAVAPSTVAPVAGPNPTSNLFLFLSIAATITKLI